MTRGRETNIAHLLADSVDDAREQWIAVFGRDRADLGPSHARDVAARAASGYTPAPQPADPGRLADVLHELPDAWSARLTAHWQLQRLQERLERVQGQAAWEAHCQQTLTPLEAERDATRVAAQRAEQAAAGRAADLTARAEQHAARLRQSWDADLAGADQAARTLAAGPSRLGVHRGRVRDAQQHLDAWATRWAEVFTGNDLELQGLRQCPGGYRSNVRQVADALYQHAQRLAAADHPEHAARLRGAERACEEYDAAAAAYHQARRELEQLSHQPVYDTGAAEQIPDLTQRIEVARHRLSRADQRVDQLATDRAITSQPDPQTLLEAAEASWAAEQVAAYQHAAFGPSSPFRSPRPEPHPTQQIDHGPSMSR